MIAIIVLVVARSSARRGPGRIIYTHMHIQNIQIAALSSSTTDLFLMIDTHPKERDSLAFE
jgi:hypothetical protein